MKTIIKDGIELLEFTSSEETLIIETVYNGYKEAYKDLFDSISGLESYFIESTDPKGNIIYVALPRLGMSIDIEHL